MVTVDGNGNDIMVVSDQSCDLDIYDAVFKFWWKASASMWKIRMVNAIGRG